MPAYQTLTAPQLSSPLIQGTSIMASGTPIDPKGGNATCSILYEARNRAIELGFKRLNGVQAAPQRIRLLNLINSHPET